MTSNRIAAIVLAAGFSSRMKDFKPLLTIGGETIVDRVISTYQQNGVEVYLVTGYQGDQLLDSLKNCNVQFVENPDYSLGMYSSVRAGLRQLPSEIDAFFVAPVDIPLVRTATIRRMMEKAVESPGKIIYPEFQHTRGHPTLIPAQLIPAILGWEKEGGLRAVLDAYQETALEVAVPDRYILFDIDTPEEYRQLLESYSRYRVPTEDECEAILTSVAAVPENIRRHCFKVAEVADNIGQALVASFVNLDLESVRAGALLHDIAKGQPDHAAAGSGWLTEMGFSGIEDIVASHTDLPIGKQAVSLEAKVVYLADKFVKEDTVIPLEERFQSALQRFGSDPGAKTDILRRRKQAFEVKDEIERLLRKLLDGVIFT
jgi:molybdenum cofactor cytidylyltransferase